MGVAALPPMAPRRCRTQAPGSSKATVYPRSLPPVGTPAPSPSVCSRREAGSAHEVKRVPSRTPTSPLPRGAQQWRAGIKPQVGRPENPSLERLSSPEKSPRRWQARTPRTAAWPLPGCPDVSHHTALRAGGARIPDTRGQTHMRRADKQGGQRRGSAGDRVSPRTHPSDQAVPTHV